MSTREEDKSLSILAVYDEMVRNGAILADGSEAEFLSYVENSEVSRQRWEHAELECQRLSIELTKCSQDITTLEHKLKHARLMLDNELHLRKKAEAERDKMANQLQQLKQLVMETDINGMDEVTINKIRGLDVCGVKPSYTNILSPGLTREALNVRVSAVNLTEASVLDVDDLSFDIDDTAGLCESRTRAGTNFRSERDEGMTRRKRSRSTTKKTELPVVVENASKKGRRSCSIGASAHVDGVKDETSRLKSRSRRSAMSEGRGRKDHTRGNMRRSTMSNSSTEGKENVKVYEEEITTDHTLVERTVIKSEKCVVCSKRVKFGKICLKCVNCKETLHMECKNNAGACHATSPKVSSNIPFPSLPTPNKRVSTYLTPSKNENKRTHFASPMLR